MERRARRYRKAQTNMVARWRAVEPFSGEAFVTECAQKWRMSEELTLGIEHSPYSTRSSSYGIFLPWFCLSMKLLMKHRRFRIMF